MIEKLEFQKRMGRRVANIRNNKNYTQRELAELCLKDQQSIDKLERGIFNPTGYYLYEIATALGVPITELFVGLEEK